MLTSVWNAKEKNLTSGNSKFDLEMRETSLLISKLKPMLNNNTSSMPLNLFYH